MLSHTKASVLGFILYQTRNGPGSDIFQEVPAKFIALYD